MSDTALPVIIHYGTDAQRLAFTPSPASGVQQLYKWYSTDTDAEWSYTTGWHQTSGSSSATPGLVGPLEQHTASASATLDFTAFISASYTTYVFDFVNLRPASDGALLWMRMGTGAGPTFDTGANYSYRYWRMAGATAVAAAAGATKIILTDAVDDDVLYGVVGQVRLYNPQSTAQCKMVNGQLFFEQTAAGGFEEDLPMGVYDSTTAVTGIQFLMSTGNITSGTIRVYGLSV